MSPGLEPASRRARALALLGLLAPTLLGCGSWQRARNVTLQAPVAFDHRVLVVGEHEAWELERARVEDDVVVGRCLRRWSVPAGAAHRWARGDLSPDATAAANHWTLATGAPTELRVYRGEVRHLLFLEDGGGAVGGFVLSGLLSVIAFITGAWAVSGGRID